MTLSYQLQAIRAEHGPWTAHNIELGKGLFTIAEGPPDRAQQRALLYIGLSETFLRRSIRSLRVLDLGCLEGGISVVFAKRGARCVGIDVRKSHIAKAEFAAKILGLSGRCNWIEADVTETKMWQRLGKFDLVICSGLLYHLDGLDIVPFLRNMRNACRKQGIAIIDTNISPTPQDCVEGHDQPILWGCNWREHESGVNIKQRLSAAWSSYSNDNAFWLTERSLTNALVFSGFGTVFKPLYPYHEWGHQARDVWLALPGPSNPARLPLRKDPDPRPLAHPGL